MSAVLNEEGSHTSPPTGDAEYCRWGSMDMGWNLRATTHSKHFKDQYLASLNLSFLI